MALQDFIQALQQEDIVYSEPEPAIRVIPPEKPQIKVIPPENFNTIPKPVEQPKVEQKVEQNVEKPVKPVKPLVIKFKIKPKSEEITPQSEPQVIQSTVPNKSVVIEPVVDKPIESTPQESIKTVEQSSVEDTSIQHELTDEEIFNNTGTEYSKKAIWMDYFNQAKNSRKKNPIVDRMKLGRFTITPDNKVLLLPDYNIVGKDPDDVLKDKWF